MADFSEYKGSKDKEILDKVTEEIMGNIRDEYDEEEEMIRKNEDGSYDVNGLCGLTELSDVLGIVFQDEDEDNEKGSGSSYSLEQITSAGESAAQSVSTPEKPVAFWSQNWRKGGLQPRRNELIKELGFYNQTFCGCEFSKPKI